MRNIVYSMEFFLQIFFRNDLFFCHDLAVRVILANFRDRDNVMR